MNKKITEKEIKKQAEKARKWALSTEGQKQIQTAMDKAKSTTEELMEASKIRPESLLTPFGL